MVDWKAMQINARDRSLLEHWKVVKCSFYYTRAFSESKTYV